MGAARVNRRPGSGWCATSVIHPTLVGPPATTGVSGRENEQTGLSGPMRDAENRSGNWARHHPQVDERGGGAGSRNGLSLFGSPPGGGVTLRDRQSEMPGKHHFLDW